MWLKDLLLLSMGLGGAPKQVVALFKNINLQYFCIIQFTKLPVGDCKILHCCQCVWMVLPKQVVALCQNINLQCFCIIQFTKLCMGDCKILHCCQRVWVVLPKQVV